MKTNFEKERLYLRPTSLDDADINLKLLNTEEFKKYVGDRNVNSLDESREYLKYRKLPQIERLGYGNFILIQKDTGEKIGSCGLFSQGWFGCCGYWIFLSPGVFWKRLWV